MNLVLIFIKLFVFVLFLLVVWKRGEARLLGHLEIAGAAANTT